MEHLIQFQHDNVNNFHSLNYAWKSWIPNFTNTKSAFFFEYRLNYLRLVYEALERFSPLGLKSSMLIEEEEEVLQLFSHVHIHSIHSGIANLNFYVSSITIEQRILSCNSFPINRFAKEDFESFPAINLMTANDQLVDFLSLLIKYCGTFVRKSFYAQDLQDNMQFEIKDCECPLIEY